MTRDDSLKPFRGKNSLGTVDKIEITSLVDNYTNVILPGTDIVTRSPFWVEGRVPPTEYPLAEHGLSLLVRAWQDGREHAVIFDAGATGVSLVYNLKALRVDLSSVRAVVLSHGHEDHFGGLTALLKFLNRPVTVIAHPDAFRQRYREFEDGRVVEMTLLPENRLARRGAKLRKVTGRMLISGCIATTGVVKRTTDFETIEPADRLIDHPAHKRDRDRVLDDISLVLHLDGKGLVIVTGCAHAGIINIIRQAQRITGVDRVYAVLGGMHLIGRNFKEKTQKTIPELKRIAPEILVPMHCNHFMATGMLAAAMPEAFILNSVGSTYELAAAGKDS